MRPRSPPGCIDRTGALELTRRLDRAARFGIELRLPFIDAAVQAHLAAGQVARAAELAAQASEASSGHPLRQRAEARMLLAGGASADALNRLRAAATGFARSGHRQDEWHTRRLLATALRNLGQRRQGQAELRRIDEEMAAADGAPVPAARSRPGPKLSAREREVALLVARGLRNREIAERLFISERTVENHIHRMLERTGLRSRSELAAHVATLSG